MNSTDSEMLAVVNERDIPPFSQNYHTVFQPTMSPDGHDEIYNLDS